MPSPLSSWIDAYKAAQRATIDAIPADAVGRIVGRLRTALAADQQVFAFGNGGSASNCSHFITDLGKGASDKLAAGARAAGEKPRRFRCMSLNDNVSWMTALGNDYAYEDVFVRQLENYARPGDVVIAVSVSGSSPNVVKACKWARENGVYVAALVGGKRGSVAGYADELVVIEDTHYGRAEDGHMAVLHMLCYAFMELPELGR
ncbi:MAG TPA: SIS domain-containing protein [Humisphaera sp.]